MSDGGARRWELVCSSLVGRKQAESEIDRLYQLPLDEFTAARNALAKKTGDAELRALSKPPLAAWAVNQLYWRERDTYDALLEAANAVRASHKAVLGGKKADLRAAGREHEEAADVALKAALALLAGAGHPVTDATRQQIVNTLRALPSDEPPGRLTRTLQPGGFEMLAGVSIAPGRAAAAREKKPVQAAAPVDRRPAREEKAREAAKRARQASAEAMRELREAEQAARREEFESARATREADRAARRLETARERLDTVQQDYDEAEKAAKEAERVKQSAERAAAAAAARLEAARTAAGID